MARATYYEHVFGTTRFGNLWITRVPGTEGTGDTGLRGARPPGRRAAGKAAARGGVSRGDGAQGQERPRENWRTTW